ncbi:hypothetical protein Dimus_032657 [Dionaea muscipula]
MPLVRFEVKNEYGLGAGKLYNAAATDAQDPKALLDGVAVAGLVGLLRQLGDLADFAAEVFHGLQEQVISTNSRSRKLMTRIQNTEAALPPLEKAMFSQTSHVHLAYTPGLEWHAQIKNQQNHFICSNLPQFILDVYEDCREPPQLQWLDKFDAGGPGSCLKKYSDPSFFRRASASSSMPNNGQLQKERKARKLKKRKSQKVNSQISHSASFFDAGSRVQLSSSTETTLDMRFKSDPRDLSHSLGSRERTSGFIECVYQPSTSLQVDEVKIMDSYSESNKQIGAPLKSVYSGEQAALMFDDIACSALVQPDEGKIMESYSGYDEQITIPPKSVYFDEQAASMLHHIAGRGSGESDEVKTKESYSESDEPTTDPLKASYYDKRAAPVLDDIPCCAELEKTSPRSPSVTWDEKTELIEATCIYSGAEDVQEVPGTNFEPQEFASKRLPGMRVDQVDTSVEGEDVSNVISSGKELDEIESGTENYVDALNTIESESDNEFDSQMKRKLELYSSISDGLADLLITEPKAEILDHDLKRHQSPLITYNHVDGALSNLDDSNSSLLVVHESLQGAESSCSLLEKDSSQIPGDSVSPVCLSAKMSTENIESSSVPNLPDIHNFAHADNADGLRRKSLVCESTSYGSRGTNTPELFQNSTVQDCLVQSSNVGSVMFWTNGNLFGLQPSKPPDFSAPNGVRCGSMTDHNDTTVLLSNLKQDVFSINSQYSDSRIDRRQGGLVYSDPVNRFHQSEYQSLSNSTPVLPQTEQPAVADAKTATIGGNHGHEEQSPFLSRLRHDFLMNGLQKSGVLSYDGKLKADVPLRSSEFENGQCHHFVETNSEEQLASPVNFSPPSPPLQHMTISFQPISGFDTCRLKLRYPDGIHDHEGTVDAFPSFQLVPELNDMKHDIDLDSDDDTFCRSHSCMSHDELSHLSDSDSEVWNSGGTRESKEKMLNDGSYGISPIESISESFDYKTTDGKSIHDNGTRETIAMMGGVHCQSSSILPPALDTVNFFPYEEPMTYNSNETMECLLPQEPSLPPPLPPMQWRISKTESYGATDEYSAVSNAPLGFSNLEPLKTSVSLQEKNTLANLVHGIEERTTMAMEIKRFAERKLNGQKESSLNVNGKKEDDKDDLLHQIRIKSFNLRHIETSRPNLTTGATTNEAVTAILVKANAIRQAVGSDDGEEDDAWSDS